MRTQPPRLPMHRATLDRVGRSAAALFLAFLCVAALGPASLAADLGDDCVGDCDGSGAVLINEVVTMVNAGLGLGSVTTCTAGDASHDGSITIDEIIAAVNRGLDGCAPCDFVLDADVSVECKGPGQSCSSSYEATFELAEEGPASLRYDAADTHCSPLRLHIVVDGNDAATSPFLAPEDSTLVVDLGSLGEGVHHIEVAAESALGGCNWGNFPGWGGRLVVWPLRCTRALSRRAALLAPPTPTPTPIPICAPAPRQDCSTAFSSSLVVRTGVKMLWKFKDPVDTSALGDPVGGGTQYGLCVYDEIEGVPYLAAHAAVEAGGICPFNKLCWQEKKEKILYKDIGYRQEGVEKIVLKESRIVYKVTGFRALPRAVDFVRFFYQDPGVTAQVVNSDGFCWEARFEAEHVGKNLPHVYRAAKR